MRPCTCDHCKIGEPWTEDQCYLCWKFHNDPAYHEMWSSGKVPPSCCNQGLVEQPSLMSQLGHLGVALVKHGLDRGRELPPEQIEERLTICKGCEHYDPAAVRCKVCSCYLNSKVLAKARWASEDCPKKKWPKVT